MVPISGIEFADQTAPEGRCAATVIQHGAQTVLFYFQCGHRAGDNAASGKGVADLFEISGRKMLHLSAETFQLAADIVF
jgi:hypothetical protein